MCHCVLAIICASLLFRRIIYYEFMMAGWRHSALASYAGIIYANSIAGFPEYTVNSKKTTKFNLFLFFIYGCIVLLFLLFFSIFKILYIYIILCNWYISNFMNNRCSLLVFVCININYHLL